jgi:cell division septation protein DedD
LAVTTSHDDAFREIQLSGKQLVFLFMAVTVVLVVTFLTGVLVGRGVRVERAEVAQDAALTDTPASPNRLPSGVTIESPGGDPRTAAPPAPAEEDGPPDAKGARAPEVNEEPPVAVRRPPVEAPAAMAKAAPTPAKGVAAAAATPARPASSPDANASATDATSQARSGYAVQVAAVNVRGEADAIVKRLSGKGYAAYVEMPKGSASMFRVRVGTFKTRREAQATADRLKKEEKFKPWVTR